MHAKLAKAVKRALSKEITRRQLMVYFDKKGFEEDYGSLVYPPAVADLGSVIPELFGKVEVQPYVEEIEPGSGRTKLGWNLFVLGTNSMHLGKTIHSSLSELKDVSNGQISENRACSEPEHSAKEIIEFVIDILGSHESGFDPAPTNAATSIDGAPFNKPVIGPSASGGYYERNKIA